MPGVVGPGFGRFSLRVSIALRDQCVGDQAVAVVAQLMAHVPQLTSGVALAIQAVVAIRARLVGVVAAPLAFELAVLR